ncbi:MAG: VirB3 family type IV secretion system protein (plasmid) [Candidatus Symbiodolus clandestinus]
MPLAVVCGGIVLASLWCTIFILLLLPLAILVMRWVVHSDDQQFRLLWLRMLFRWANANGSFWKTSVYSSYRFERRNL